MAVPVWMILWAVAAMIAGGLMFAAWTGPHQSVSNISRWAMRLRIRHIPFWLSARDADRWAFRGGLVAIVLLLGAAWFIPSHQTPDAPVSAPSDSGKVDSGKIDTDKGALAPPPVGGDRAVVNRRPDRHIDTDLKNAILVHVPKSKPIRIVVLKDDPEGDQFSWEIDAFLRAEGYRVMPRLFFSMAAGGKVPSGTTIYPDENDSNIFVIRIGLNDRS
jgi:hypothetical protein